MSKKVKRVLIGIGIVGIIIGLAYLQRCPNPQPTPPNQQDYVLEEKTYQPPIIKIPFIDPKLPVAKELLPLPTKDIKKTIEIEVPPSDKPTKVIVIIDKKDRILKAKDTPKNVVVKITKWKAKLLEFGFHLGVTAAIQPKDIYFCLSVNLLRIWKIYFGSDIGISSNRFDRPFNKYLPGDGFLSGLAIRYKILPKNNLFISAGWNFSQQAPYVGVSLFF